MTIPVPNPKAKIYYNFCENTLFSCKDVSSLMIADYGNGVCERLAGTAKNVNKWTLEKDPKDEKQSIIVIALNQGQSCKTNPAQNYTVTYKLSCDKQGDKRKLNWDDASLKAFDPESCTNTLVASSVEACSQVNFYILADFLEKYKWLLGSGMILIGIFELFFGVKLVVLTTFIISAVVVVSVAFVFFIEYIIPKGSNPNIVWVVLGISAVLGLVMGYFLAKVYKVFVGIFGGYIGYLLGTLLYTFAMSHIDWNQSALQWITICSMILICLLLSYFFADYILITCTSFVGGYLTIRGISLYAGGFPNEQLIKDLMNKGEYEEINKVLNWVAYVYFAAWIVLFIIGIVVQVKINKEGEKNIDEKKINNTNFYFKMDK